MNAEAPPAAPAALPPARGVAPEGSAPEGLAPEGLVPGAGCRRDLAVRPDLAPALEALGRASGETRWFRRALAAAPDFVAAWVNLAALEVSAERSDRGKPRAGAALRCALALAPAEPAAWFNLGLVQETVQAARVPEIVRAEISYARTLALDPVALDAACHRAALLTQAAPSRGERALRRGLAVFPDLAAGLNALARLLQNGAEGPAAARWFRRAHLLRPEDAALRGNWLLQLAYDPDLAPALLLARHRRAMAPLAPGEERRDDTEEEIGDESGIRESGIRESGAGPRRPLRVGFVSADLARHPVGFFLAPVLENRDPRALETVCYSGRAAAAADAWTRRLRAACDLWVETAGLDDAALEARIRADRIDLLVDLSGHTAGNRLAVFARRPAPVQASWMGYPGTTGLPQIDWLIADAAQIPPGSESGYAERILRLAPGYVCYAPPQDAPDVGPLPARREGRGGAAGPGELAFGFTFGSLNNIAKLNPAVFRLWARVLDAVPGARLLLAWQSLGDPEVARRVRAMAAAGGIRSERLALRPGAAPADFLAHYAEIDIALDPFPYSGGLTTLEALWMGVPVLTWSGPGPGPESGSGFAGRHAASHLAQAGLADWIAPTQEAYVARAARAAADPDALDRLRAGLRDRLRASALLDGAAFARRFEAACRTMWRDRRPARFARVPSP